MKKLIKNIFYIFLPLILGGLVSLLITKNIDYNELIKPPLAPPSIVFPIAWTIIYFFMGLSYFALNTRYKEDISYESIIYYLQLFINILWSIIFFLLKWRFFACIWIILLDIVVAYMIYLFFRKDKISAYLNIPYFIWILFATYLTIGIFFLN